VAVPGDRKEQRLVNPEKWQQMKQLFASALDLAPEARHQFLGNACGGDESLLAEMEALLSADEADQSASTGLASTPVRTPITRWDGQKVGPQGAPPRTAHVTQAGIWPRGLERPAERPLSTSGLSNEVPRLRSRDLRRKRASSESPVHFLAQDYRVVGVRFVMLVSRKCNFFFTFGERAGSQGCT
jgi:hypothetical protein